MFEKFNHYIQVYFLYMCIQHMVLFYWLLIFGRVVLLNIWTFIRKQNILLLSNKQINLLSKQILLHLLFLPLLMKLQWFNNKEIQMIKMVKIKTNIPKYFH